VPAALALLTLLLGAAPRAGTDARCAVARGAPWHELRTPHFTVTADLAPEDAAALAALLETALEAVRAAVPGAPAELPGRLPVVAFSRWDEFHDLAPGGSLAYFMARPGGEAAIVLVGDLERDLRPVTIGHEITHYVLARTFQWQPYWVSEGLAKNMEDALEQATSAGSGEGRGPLEPRPDLLRDARRPYRAKVAEVLAAPRPERVSPGAYATGWLLVRYLLAQHRDAFGAFMRRLDRAEDPGAAWRAEFPAWDPAVAGSAARLDEALSEYARNGARWERPRPARGGRPSTGHVERLAELSPAEVHALRIRLASQSDSPRARARLQAELEEVLAEDPANVAALWVGSGSSRQPDLASARSATANHPGDGRAWLLLARASGGEEREDALRRAADLSTDDAAALEVLAEERRKERRFEEALPAAKRAAELAPWSPIIAGTLADAALEAGPCAEAVAFASRALELIPASAADSRWRAHAGRRIEKSWARCAPLLVGPHGERRPPTQEGASPAPIPASRTPP
jgi:tetratricopeptide (TPR) repeat protein